MVKIGSKPYEQMDDLGVQYPYFLDIFQLFPKKNLALNEPFVMLYILSGGARCLTGSEINEGDPITTGT